MKTGILNLILGGAAITAGVLAIYDIENLDRYILGLTTVIGFVEKFKADSKTKEVKTDLILTESDLEVMTEKNNQLVKDKVALMNEIKALNTPQVENKEVKKTVKKTTKSK